MLYFTQDSMVIQHAGFTLDANPLIFWYLRGVIEGGTLFLCHSIQLHLIFLRWVLRDATRCKTRLVFGQQDLTCRLGEGRKHRQLFIAHNSFKLLIDDLVGALHLPRT